MGNHHSATHSPKKAGSLKGECERKCDSELDSHTSSASLAPSINTILCNTPYLTVMFEKLAEESHATDSSVKAGIVSRPVFEKTFNGPLKLLGKLLYDHMCGQHDEQVTGVDCESFLKVATDILGLINVEQQINYYFNVFSRQGRMTAEEAHQMVMSCFSVALASAYLPYEPSQTDEKILSAFTTTLLTAGGDELLLTRCTFAAWCPRNCPNLFNGVHCFLIIKLSGGSSFDDDHGWHKRLSQENSSIINGSLPLPQSLPNASTPPSAATSMLSALQSSSSALCLSLVWLLSCTLPSKYIIPCLSQNSSNAANRTTTAFVPNFLVSKLHQITEHNAWTLLYNSDQHGLSTNRFETYVFSYKGPTITLVTFESNLYAIGSDSEWRESLQRWGGDDSVLLQLLPQFSVVQTGRDLLYLNHHHRGAYKGIQVGKDSRNLVLQIDDMATVRYCGVDLRLQQVEVWGCAGAEAKEQQTRQRQWEHKEVDKLTNRKLKLEEWEDNPDRQLLSWAGINTNHAQKT